jgi:peptidoglycan/xylan/chitin deacetylase (PgdA/CDA1 family)
VTLHWPPLARLALWTTSVAGLCAGASALLGARPPFSLALAGLVLEATLATAGVLAPSLGVFGTVYARGPAERAELALTFDDGPSPETTPRVLALLEQHGARATFFVVGSKARAHPTLVRAIAAAGHAIGVHGHVHDPLYALRSARFVERDLARACAAVAEATGVVPRLFRPPIGFVSSAVAVAAERHGLTLVGWTVRTLDGFSGTAPERVLARATAALERGAILLLHDAAARDDRVPPGLAVLPELLTRVRQRGLEAVTVDALRR